MPKAILQIETRYGDIKISTIKDLHVYIDNFSVHYLYFSSQSTSNHIKAQLNSLVTIAINKFSTLCSRMEHLENSNEETTEEALQELLNFLACISFPLPSTPLSEFLSNLGKNAPALASAAFLCSIKSDETNNNVEANKILNSIYQFQSNSNRTDQKEVELNKFSRFFNEANRIVMRFELYNDYSDSSALLDRLNHSENTIADRANELAGTVAEAEQELSEFKGWIQQSKELDEDNQRKREGYQSSRFRNGMKRALNHYKYAKSKLGDAEKAYREKVSINASVTYWESKETEHNDDVKLWIKCVFGAVVATAILPPILVAMFNNPTATEGIFSSFSPTAMSVLAISLSLCSFIIRFSSQQFTSAKHLLLEAKERKTMLKTYLALMGEGKLNDNEDRKVALDTLFRPAKTGIVADNTPIIPSEGIIKVFDKRNT